MASKFLLVAKREYLTRVRKRAFVVLTLLVPFIIAGFRVLVGKLALSDESTEIVDVRDDSGLNLAAKLVPLSTPQLQFVPVAGSLPDAKQGFQKQKHAGLLYLPAGLDVQYPQGNHAGHAGAVLGQQLVEALGLGHRAREAVEDKAGGLRIALQGIANHADNYLIGHEQTLIHQLFGLQTQLGTFGNLGAEEVASAQVHEVVLGNELLALGAFARAGGAEEDDVMHGWL